MVGRGLARLQKISRGENVLQPKIPLSINSPKAMRFTALEQQKWPKSTRYSKLVYVVLVVIVFCAFLEFLCPLGENQKNAYPKLKIGILDNKIRFTLTTY